MHFLFYSSDRLQQGQSLNFAEGATGRIVRLRHDYQSNASIEKIIFKGELIHFGGRSTLLRSLEHNLIFPCVYVVGKYRKRSEAYRSRRYALSKRNDVLDAILLIKKNSEPVSNGAPNASFPKIASSANLLKS